MPYPIEVNDTRGIIWYHYTSRGVRRHDRGSVRRDARPVRRPAPRVPISFLHPFVVRRAGTASAGCAGPPPSTSVGHRDRVCLAHAPRANICAPTSSRCRRRHRTRAAGRSALLKAPSWSSRISACAPELKVGPPPGHRGGLDRLQELPRWSRPWSKARRMWAITASGPPIGEMPMMNHLAVPDPRAPCLRPMSTARTVGLPRLHVLGRSSLATQSQKG
jgi:hypothetical protein